MTKSPVPDNEAGNSSPQEGIGQNRPKISEKVSLKKTKKQKKAGITLWFLSVSIRNTLTVSKKWNFTYLPPLYQIITEVTPEKCCLFLNIMALKYLLAYQSPSKQASKQGLSKFHTKLLWLITLITLDGGG